MEIKSIIEKSNLKLETNIKYKEPMKNHTTFKIGGPAEVYINIKNKEDLKKILEFSNKNNIKITIIGNGSNLLILDKGIKGITLKIDMQKFKIDNIENEKVTLTIGSGNKLIEFAHKLLKEELTGFEKISGIPGTIGGAIRMNAGANGQEIGEFVKKVKCIDFHGNEKEFSKKECKFTYRNSRFEDRKYIITEVQFELKKGIFKKIDEEMKKYSEIRRNKQPLEYPNAGSTFKRGDGFITAQLIDETGLKGYKIGGASISTKHAGFIINEGNATAEDVTNLIKYAEKKVYEKFNKKIKLEIEIIGEK